MIERFAGRYALLRPLGQGGMGEVFLARDLTTGRECALKRVSGTVATPPELLRSEFAILARLRHPAIVAVHELDFAPDGTPFYTMEYVPGVPADRALAGADATALAWVASQIALGLEALHAAGIVHGDLKPPNVLVVPSPVPGRLPLAVRMLDFGLAGLLGHERQGHRGTAGFAAPEVVRGEAPSPASDLYGFGALLYALIAKRPPYEGEGLETLLREQQAGPPPARPLADAGASPALVELVLRLLASDPRERPRDAGTLRRELEAIEPAARRPLTERFESVVVAGRERELARFEGWLARGKKMRAIVLAGPAGIGKSALLGEMASRATLAGRAVAYLSCSSFTGPAAVASALARRFAVAAGADPDSLPDPTLTPERPSQEDALAALIDAVLAHGRRIEDPERVPIVLLDDSERLDPLSRAFLLRVALDPNAPATFWAWARRDDDKASGTAERTLFDAGVAERLELAPIGPDDVARVAAARLQHPAPEALVAWLWVRGAGNPGLTVALLRMAAESGALKDSDAGLWVDEPALDGLALPSRFEESLIARAGSLPDSARAVMDVLAVLGHAIEPNRALTIARAASDPSLDLEEGLRRLEEAGFAKRDADGRVGLTPPALDQPWLERLDDVRRRALHRAALAESGTSEDRFRHLAGAGDVAAALAVAREALEARFDPRFAGEAAALAEPEQPALAAALWERQATAWIANGRHAAAIPALERSLVLAPMAEERHVRRATLAAAFLRAGDLERHASLTAQALADGPPPAQRARLLANQAAGLEIGGALERARAIAAEALAVAESTPDAEAMIGLAASTLAAMNVRQGEYEAALTLARRAEVAHRHAGNLSGAIRASVLPAWIAQERHRPEEADAFYRRAIVEAQQAGLRLALGELLIQHAVTLSEAGRWSEAREQCSQAARLALGDGRPGEAAAAFANLAQLEGLDGSGHAALRGGRAALRLARAHAPRMQPLALRTLAQAHRILGRPARAERLARRAVRLAIELTLPAEIEWGRVELARSWIALGRWQDVDELVTRIEADSAPARSVARVALATLGGRAALRRAAPARAEQRLATAEAGLEGRTAPFARALTDVLRAEIAFTRGRSPEGIRLADRALTALDELPAPVERAAASLEMALLVTQRRATTSAPVVEWLDRAVAVFERLGDVRSQERSRGLQVEWLRRSLASSGIQVRERDLIEAVSRLLNSMSDLQELTQRAMRLAVEQLDAERGVLLLADPETGRMSPIAELGAVDASMRNRAVGYSRRIVERVTESGSSLLVGDGPSDPATRSESVVDLNLLSIVCVPMFVAGRVVGAVYLDDSRRAAAFGDADRALLEGFAQLMAIAIENSRGHLEVMRANEELVGENLALRRAVGSRFQPQALIGRSLAMQKVLAVVEQAAKSNATVLLTGENGTGKELVASILHHAGKRHLKPFVAVNCGAITETLLESELFGILDDVATQVRKRDGRFVQANGGTLFLDEIGDMPLKQQVALLGVLANREIVPVGGGRAIPVDVRIVAATNRNLPRLIEQGLFREDLYFRLNVIPIEIPPLRERKADIPALARHFLDEFARQQERPVPELSPNFMAVLTQSDWPGNVRELQNYMERLLAMQSKPTLEPIPLPRDLGERVDSVRLSEGLGLLAAVESLERKLLLDALERANGNQSLAARELDMTEQSLRYRLRKYALSSVRTRRNLRLRKNSPFRGKQ